MTKVRLLKSDRDRAIFPSVRHGMWSLVTLAAFGVDGISGLSLLFGFG